MVALPRVRGVIFATASGRAVIGETPQWVIFSRTRPIAIQTRPMIYWIIRWGNCLVRMVILPRFDKMPKLAVCRQGQTLHTKCDCRTLIYIITAFSPTVKLEFMRPVTIKRCDTAQGYAKI